ncbi:MAG: XRE family transcriptional regulator [Candidatus Abyssobacteria bacterium SURF_5]|jgi:transcriptional regulator with XRE-family HTH domain|uniref:XRE family transcriptional regulator n=1 Tax=Abyssobacteria bacterium (strain SURF_5) TaxID=2093360 RepID=A0A3A4NHA8_ABYX5|nr:MAG: XRE family transcriptional regulator [Candidatus Abyssubacteria bacterium SURF_5]
MQKLGDFLKQARLSREMTLEELSEKCGYSKALISRVENNNVSPSITSLAQMAAALELKLYDVFASCDGDEPVIVRKDERRRFSQMDGRQDIEFLTNGAYAKKMQPLLISLNNGLNDNTCTGHKGEEFLHILQGKAEVVVNGARFILGAGDSIHFRSSSPHCYRGIGKGKTISLKVVSPPFY